MSEETNMTSDEQSPEPEPKKKKDSGSRRQIRGSSLFVIGRFLSLGANFLTQILIVRYLSKADYGSFAYALSMVMLIETIATLGLDRAITRFIPIFDEKKEYANLLGTILFVITTILSLAVGLILLFFAFQGFISQTLISDSQALALLSIMIFLAPLQALSNLINGMFAVLSSPRAIFFRRYVFGPGLRILVVLLLIVNNQSIEFLATGYMLSGFVIVIFFGIWLYQIMKNANLFNHVGFAQLQFPIREVLAFTFPLLASDILFMVMETIDVVMLENFQTTAAIADLRAVLPLARMNQLVLATFAMLFTPTAARLFAREDKEGLNNLYWQNAAWAAILSFPIFALTFSIAQPLTVFLFGEQYASSAAILAILSFGFYFDAALGQNGLTLKVMGKLRYITVIYLGAAVISVVLNVIFIPLYGALGAAIGTAGTLILFNLMKQAGLRLGTGISIFNIAYRSMYLSIMAAAGSLLLLQILFSPGFIISFILATIVSIAVVRFNRRLLDIENTFPELMKIPPVRWLLGS
jgi:O-antigen/teichoic acid export membrane protein